jgi:hypothetical protein
MRRLDISPVDAIFADGSYPIEFLFYFERAFDTQRLRAGLRRLSSLFWPAFGEYADGSIHFDRYDEAGTYDEEWQDRELDIGEISGAGAAAVVRFALPALERLFFLKVTRFRNGLAVVPKLNHLAGDGYSYFLLLSALAALTRPNRMPFRPAFLKMALRLDHNRAALPDFSFRGVNRTPLPAPGELRIEQDVIPRAEVLAVIQETAESAVLRVSSNDVLSAMAMKKLAGGGRERRGGEFDLTMPIDLRGRVKGYGRGSFGNAIMFHTVTFKREEVESSAVPHLATRIRRARPVLSAETALAFLKSLAAIRAAERWAEFRPYDPERGCLVTNLSRLPTDRLDFGTGPPRLVVPLTVEKNSVGILARGDGFLLRSAV